MKRQVRYGLFETNSSSTHSLTILALPDTPNIKQIIGGDTIMVGKLSADEVEKMDTGGMFSITQKSDWQYKLDYFWWGIHESDGGYARDIYTHLKVKQLIIDVFKKYDISVKFNDDIEKYRYVDLYGSYVTMDYIIGDLDDVEEFENIFLSYLFNDVLYYTFCDEGCSGHLYDNAMETIRKAYEPFASKPGWHYDKRC